MRNLVLITIITILLAACSPLTPPGNSILTPNAQTQIANLVIRQQTIGAQPDPTDFLPMTDTPLPPTETISPTVTLTSTPTLIPTSTLTPTWIPVTAGEIVAPILLYHHIADTNVGNRYYISTVTFDEQMRILNEWGYTAITVSAFAKVLTQGGELPQRPVLITFDDGNLDIYQNAFPIMRKYGYTGTVYMIANRVGAKDCVTADQLKEMAAAGWEIGSHGMTHVDLTQNHASLSWEIAYSRINLEKDLGVPIRTFAYPFGMIDPTVATKVQDYGYFSAVGLGTSTTHSRWTLYYLNREEVRSSYNTDAFKALLPWQGPPA